MLELARKDSDDISGNEDQRYCLREVFEARKRFKVFCSKVEQQKIGEQKNENDKTTNKND